MWHAMKRGQVFIIQTVAGIYFQTERVRLFRPINQALQFRLTLGGIMKMFGELPGVQFDEFAAGAGGRFDLLRVGRDEEADFDAGIVHPFACFGQGSFVADDIEAAFGGDFLPAFRHEADDMWLEFQRNGDDLGRIGHFEIQARFDGFAQTPHVAILNVPAVLAQMCGNAMRAGSFTEQGGFNGARFAVGQTPIAGFADSGDVVNVDSEF